VLTRTAYNEACCCTKIFQSAAEFSNVGPEASNFLKALTKYIYEILICNYEYTIAYICASRK